MVLAKEQQLLLKKLKGMEVQIRGRMHHKLVCGAGESIQIVVEIRESNI